MKDDAKAKPSSDLNDNASDGQSKYFPKLEDDCDFRAIESTVSWIEQDSASKPEEYLDECNTKICGE